MFLTGYHGTALDRAEKILKDGYFDISNGDTEWLGEGIYYYFDITDAYNWRGAEAILHSVIKIEDNEYLDIDSKVGGDVYNEMIDYISSSQNKTVTESASVQQNQCAVMKMLWETYPELKAISASFHVEKTKIKTLLDRRCTRKEFCIRNNNPIKCTQLIRKDDLDD